MIPRHEEIGLNFLKLQGDTSGGVHDSAGAFIPSRTPSLDPNRAPDLMTEEIFDLLNTQSKFISGGPHRMLLERTAQAMVANNSSKLSKISSLGFLRSDTGDQQAYAETGINCSNRYLRKQIQSRHSWLLWGDREIPSRHLGPRLVDTNDSKTVAITVAAETPTGRIRGLSTGGRPRKSTSEGYVLTLYDWLSHYYAIRKIDFAVTSCI